MTKSSDDLMPSFHFTRNKVIKGCNLQISVLMNLKCCDTICSDMLLRLNMNLGCSMVGCWKIDGSLCCLLLTGQSSSCKYEAMIAVSAASTCIIEFNVACMPIVACIILSSMMMVVIRQSSLKIGRCLLIKDNTSMIARRWLSKYFYLNYNTKTLAILAV